MQEDSNVVIHRYPVIYITEEVLSRTANILLDFAKPTPSEGVVYWFGIEGSHAGAVTTLIVPNATTSWGCITTSAEENARVLRTIIGTNLVLLGQAHSHPRNHVRHSRIDDRDTFANFDGAISVVVPYYGRKGIRLTRCGIHRHISGSFQVIQPKNISSHIRVIPNTINLRNT